MRYLVAFMALCFSTSLVFADVDATTEESPVVVVPQEDGQDEVATSDPVKNEKKDKSGCGCGK